MAREFTNDEDGNRFSFEPSTDEEGEEEAQEGEPEPSLDDLDEETLQRVQTFYARQQQQQRDRLQEQGLDLAQDGQLVVRDPGKFSQWAAPVASTPGRQQTSPPPASPPTASPAEEESPLPVDLMALSGPEQIQAIERIVQRATAPLVQQNQELRGQLQRRSAREAMAGVRQAVETYAPEIVGILDHPDFAAEYWKQAESMAPQALEDPRLVAAMAAGLRPYLSASPNTPPAPRERQPAPQERDRDEQGRFLEVANNRNQRNVGQVPPARGGMAPPQPRDAFARDTERFIGTFKEYATGKVASKPVTSRDVDMTELTDYAEWNAARKAGGGRR